MRQSRHLALSSVGVAALALGVMLSGCGGISTTTAGQGTAQLAAASTATAVAEDSTATAVAVNSAAVPTTPLPPPDPASLETAGCPTFMGGPVAPRYTTVAGLKVSIPQRWTMLDYPSERMPSNLPNAPYKVPLTASEAQIGAFHPNPPVNPSLSTGYAVQVCNQTSAAHTLRDISVAIASFIPSNGPVTVWHLCEGGPYDAATKQTTGGCGGSFGQVDWLAVNLTTNNTGASATAVANNVGGAVGGPSLPITLAPNESIVFSIAVNGLTTQGTYTLSFGLGVDGATPTTLAASDGAFFIAPSPTVWTGTACQAPAMQAQIPASTQDVYYVCPPAS